MEGDEVFIPELRPQEHDGPTEKRHRFRRKGVPAKLRLQILREPKPEEEAQSSASPVLPDALRGESRNVHTEDPEPTNQQLEDEPRANVPYFLDVDGVLTEGSTDDDGRIECSIPPNAQRGKLVLEPGTPDETEIALNLGYLDPIDEPSGVVQRLANLGVGCEDLEQPDAPEYEAAVRVFQEKYGLPITGEVDDATRSQLEQIHDN